MTSKQYRMLGEDPPGVRLELVHGEIRVTPGQTVEHSSTMMSLGLLLKSHAEAEGLGDVILNTDVVFDDENTLRPDIVFYSKGRLNLAGWDVPFGRPDLCVEIISAGSAEFDRQEKFRFYNEARVAYYWIVDPRGRMIEAFVLEGGRYLPAVMGRDKNVVKLPPFMGLSIPLAKIWRQG